MVRRPGWVGSGWVSPGRHTASGSRRTAAAGGPEGSDSCRHPNGRTSWRETGAKTQEDGSKEVLAAPWGFPQAEAPAHLRPLARNASNSAAILQERAGWLCSVEQLVNTTWSPAGKKKRLGLRAGPHGHREDLWAGGKRFAHAQLPLSPLTQACHDVGISHLLASSPINPKKFTTHNSSLSSNPNHFVILIARLHPTNGTVRTRA